VLDELPEVELVVFHEGAVRDQGQDGGEDSDASQDDGSSLWTETKAADFHLGHF